MQAAALEAARAPKTVEVTYEFVEDSTTKITPSMTYEEIVEAYNEGREIIFIDSYRRYHLATPIDYAYITWVSESYDNTYVVMCNRMDGGLWTTTSYKRVTSVPDTLPNPNKLTFTGAVSAEYDGSEEVSVEIPSGGSGLTWRKVADVTLPENATEIVIDSDTDGNSFELSIAFFSAVFPANADNTETTTSFWIYFNNTKSGNRIISSLTATTTTKRYLCGTIMTGADASKSILCSGNVSAYGELDDPLEGDSYFKSMSILCKTDGNTFAAGTRIVIWGCDAPISEVES